MKKIGIITLNGYHNYGNRLQNYALQTTLERMGFVADTLVGKDNNQVKKQNVSYMNRILKIMKQPLSNTMESVNRKIKNIIYKNRINLREEIFKDFSDKYINECSYMITNDAIPEGMAEEYNFFIVGSDQVWNPHYKKGSPIEFLTFAPKHKRISYAASFVISEIPEEYKRIYTNYLSEMNHISVREDAGADIVRSLTGREAEVVLDPTLLLSKEEWMEIAETDPDKPKNGYILTYFLGEIPKDRKGFINRISKEHNLEVINLAQLREKTPYLTGPSE